MIPKKKEYAPIQIWMPKLLQYFLNLSLILLATLLVILLTKEILHFFNMLINGDTHKEHSEILANILIFFLYFEFITMIVKYFKENYHFPLRYFIYIGITALLRLIVLDHSEPMHTLIYAIVILLLIVGYFIINVTPLERPRRLSLKFYQYTADEKRKNSEH